MKIPRRSFIAALFAPFLVRIGLAKPRPKIPTATMPLLDVIYQADPLIARYGSGYKFGWTGFKVGKHAAS